MRGLVGSNRAWRSSARRLLVTAFGVMLGLAVTVPVFAAEGVDSTRRS